MPIGIDTLSKVSESHVKSNSGQSSEEYSVESSVILEDKMEDMNMSSSMSADSSSSGGSDSNDSEYRIYDLSPY